LTKITTIHFNFLKLLDRILVYLFRRKYVITSFQITSRLRHHYVIDVIILVKWVLSWFMPKITKLRLHFLKLFRENYWLLFFLTRR